MLTLRIMTKSTAINIFGTVANLAKALGISRSAIYQWPDELPQRLSDQIIGAAVRIERATRARDPQRVVHRWELNEIFLDDLDETA